VVLALVAGAAVRLTRPVPSPTAVLALPATVVAPGTTPAFPWPSTGQGAVFVPAFGLAGTSGPETPVPIASLTKMMTAYLVLQAHPLQPGAQGPTVTLTASDEAEANADQQAGNAFVPVQAGEQLTERQLLEGLLLPSADNLADVLATWVAGSTGAFVGSMNAMAVSLGLGHTHYADASGLDPRSVSTASDQLRLAAAAMTIPVFAAIVDQTSTTLPVAGTVANVVHSIGVDGIVGVKSGFTDAAKGCLVLAATRTVGGHPVLVFAAVTGQGGADPLAAAAAATQSLIDMEGSALEPVSLAGARTVVAKERTPWGASVPMVAARGSVVAVTWSGAVLRLRLRPSAGGGGTAGTGARSRTATLVVSDGGEVLAVRVTATKPVPGPSLLWRLLHG